MKTKSMHQVWIMAAIVGGLLLSARPAQAQTVYGGIPGGFIDGAFIAGDLLVGVTPLVFTSMDVAQHRHAVVAPVFGLVAGGVLLLQTGILVGVGASGGGLSGGPWSPGDWTTFAVGAGLGAADVTMAIWALAIPRHPAVPDTRAASNAARWSLMPLAARDASGRAVTGLSLGIVSF